MAILCAPINGIGLGHVARSVQICTTLQKLGYQPAIVSIGCYPDYFRRLVPGVSLSTLLSVDSSRLIRCVKAYLAMSSPSILIEDTNPLPVDLGEGIARILIIRPPTFEQLLTLRYEYSGVYSRCLMADSPNSPTWPYSDTETCEIQRWPNWAFLGPIFRAPSRAGVANVRRRYNMVSGRRLYVFTMGGGGRQFHGQHDTHAFLEQAVSAASQLRASDHSCRLLFVRGPLFPANVTIPDLFEVTAEEPFMPDLLSQANGAIIRPGYNTVWECLRSGTPFMAIEGTTFREPVQARLKRIGLAGLIREGGIANWHDDSWQTQFRRHSMARIGRWSGEPDPQVLNETMRLAATGESAREGTCAPIRRTIDYAYVYRSLRAVRDSAASRPSFVIRVDDVVDLDEPLIWILQECRSRNVSLSLGVVPYLSNLTERSFDEWGRGTSLEILQHGYAHLPQMDGCQLVGEYIAEMEPISDVVSESIRHGYLRISAHFPKLFFGGYAPPYDGLPRWLPHVWKSTGGNYLSVIEHRTESELPLVRMRIDLWNWSTNQARPVEALVGDIVEEILRNRYAGIVAHPQLLRGSFARDCFVRMLDLLTGAGLMGAVSHTIMHVPSREQHCERNKPT